MAGIDGSTAMLRRPALSPDASEIAFAHAGDVWVAPAEGGTALRITSHPSEDYSPALACP